MTIPKEEQESSQNNPKVLKSAAMTAIMGEMIKCMNQVPDDTNETPNLYPSITVHHYETLTDLPKFAEVIKKDPNAEESPEVKAEQAKEQLIASPLKVVFDKANLNSGQIVSVSVLPTVYLQEEGDNEQLTFIKEDISNSLKSQLGAEFGQVEEQWGQAFDTMMKFVK